MPEYEASHPITPGEIDRLLAHTYRGVQNAPQKQSISSKVRSACLRLAALYSQSHPFFIADVLRIVPRMPKPRHDLDHEAAHEDKQDVVQQTTHHDQAGH